MHNTGDYSISDLAEVFSVSRPAVYRTLGRQRPGEFAFPGQSQEGREFA
jgi:hypothetical protein